MIGCSAHKKPPYPHLWLCQSAYSFLQGASLPHELLKAAIQKRFNGVCLSDFDGAYGLARFYLSCQKIWKALLESSHSTEESERISAFSQQFRCFYGAQIRLNLGRGDLLRSHFTFPPHCDLESLTAPSFLQPRVSLIAENINGYGSLCRLLRYTHRHGKQAEILSLEDAEIPWPRGSVSAILPMRGWSCLATSTPDLYDQWLADLQSFAELWKSLTDSPLFLALTPPSSPLEIESLKAHLRAHKELKIPLLATEDVFFATPEDLQISHLMQAIRLNQSLEEVGTWACFPNSARHISDPKQLLEFCKGDPRFQIALQNNFQLARRMQFCMSELHYHYPQEFVPQGFTAFSFLEKLVWEAAHEVYRGSLPTRICNILRKELRLVEELQFADYFLTVWDIVQFAKKAQILYQGRGSAANSSICYVLGITAVDPMKHDVLFERFISRERGEPPDIDVDFEHERREEVIQYIYTRYGRERAAMVANVVCFRRQGALRATAKALGAPLHEVDELLQGRQDRFQKGRSSDEVLLERISELKETGKISFAFSPEFCEHWFSLAERIEGLPRNLGIHSGGFVISHTSLDLLCPVEPATMEGRSVIQWCKDDLEEMGLFKIDVLALGMLTALRKCLTALNAHGHLLPHPDHGTPEPLSLSNIPPGCTKTYDIICAAKTMGTFQIESRAQMAIIPRLQPRCFYDLVIQIGIIRPGPIVAGTVTRYVARRTKKMPITYPDSRLEPILARTLGVPVFQEQVMRVAMTVGNFTPGEADELRRCMGAWKLNGTIHLFEEKLRQGMQENQIPQHFADEIYRQIEGFSAYGFPESHAISFAHLAYLSAWLKANHPAYFLFGLLNSQPLGFYSVHSLVQEARRDGVRVLPPCLVESQWDHQISKQKEIRLGLRIIKGLAEHDVERFLKKRHIWASEHAPRHAQHSQFRVLSSCDLLHSLDHFLQLLESCFDLQTRTDMVMGNLLAAFSSDRRMLLWYLLARPGALRSDVSLRPFSSEKPDWREHFLDLRDEARASGTTLGLHPLTLIKQHAWPFSSCPTHQLSRAEDLMKTPAWRWVNICGFVSIKQAPPTAKGMIFVTLEDESGFANLTFTPQVAERYRKILTGAGRSILCIRGQFQGPQFGQSIKVQKVYAPDRLQDEFPPQHRENSQLHGQVAVAREKDPVPAKDRSGYDS